MKRNLTRLAIVCALATATAIALLLSGAGAQALQMVAALGRSGPSTVGAALGLSMLGALISGVLWWRLLQQLGYRTPFRAALAAYLNAGLAGYVVNIAGPALGSALSLRRHGVTPGRAVLLTLLANALGFCGILVWAPLGLQLLSRTGMDSALPIIGPYGPTVAAIILAALALAMVLVLHALATAAGSRNRLARFLLGSARSTDVDESARPRGRQLLGLIPYSALSWVAGVAALYVVLVAMNHGAAVSLVTVIGASALAAALGSLAFFAPEGVGVKDGALVALLTHATGLPITTCLAAALAVRALDPLTKLGLLAVLALRADVVVGRLLKGAAVSARRDALHVRLPVGMAAIGRRGSALLGAGILAPVLVLSGLGGTTHADRDVRAACTASRPAQVSTASYERQSSPITCVGGTTTAGSTMPTSLTQVPNLNTAGDADGQPVRA